MILKSLEADGFKLLQIDRLDFANGVTLIRGRNETGKSTIMEAILFALYGLVIKPKANPSSSDIIEYNAEQARVVLNFTVGNQGYRVMRQIFRSGKKASVAKLWKILPNGRLEGLETRWKGVTETVVRLLGGVTYHEMVSSCVVAQKELGKLIAQERGRREQIINIFLNLNDFNKVESMLSERRKEVVGPRGKGGILDNERTRLDALNIELQDLVTKQGQKQEKEAELETTVTELGKTRGLLSSKKPILDSLVHYNEILVKRERMEERIKGLEGQAEVLERQLVDLATTRNEMEEKRKQRDELAYLDDSAARIRDIETILEEVVDTRRHIGSKSEVLDGATKKLTELDSQKRELTPSPEEKAILARPDVNTRHLRILVIPLLLLVVLGLAANYLFLLPAMLVILYVALKSFQAINLQSLKAKAGLKHAKYRSIEELIDGKQDEIGRIQEELHELQSLEASSVSRLSQIQSELPNALTREVVGDDPVAAGREIGTRFRELEGKRNELSREIGQMERQLSKEPGIRQQDLELREKVRILRKEHDDLEYPELPSNMVFSKDLLERYRSEVGGLREEESTLKERERELTEVLSELTSYLEERKDVPEQVENQQAKVRALEQELKTLDLVIEAITKTTEAARQRVKPAVEFFMQQILPAITADRYKAVRLSDDYDVSIFVPDRGEFVQKEVFSGGTEDQLLLAARIAFALSLLPRGKHTQPEFLFLDEPLGSSDEVRREGIMNLTRTILKETFQQIFIISHVTGLEEWADSIVELEDGRIVSSS